jgi:hypothetical protein
MSEENQSCEAGAGETVAEPQTQADKTTLEEGSASAVSIIENAQILVPLPHSDWDNFREKFRRELGAVGNEEAILLDGVRKLQWVGFGDRRG